MYFPVTYKQANGSGTKREERTRQQVYLLHLSDHLISHVGVTFREVPTSVNGDATLISRLDVQRTLGVEGILARRRILEVRGPLANPGNA